MPTTSCQRASTSPRSSAPLCTASSTSSSAARVGAVDRVARARRPSAACSASARSTDADAAREAVERAGQRAADERRRAPCGVGGEPVQPRRARARARRPGAARPRARVSGTTSSSRRLRPRSRHHRAQVHRRPRRRSRAARGRGRATARCRARARPGAAPTARRRRSGPRVVTNSHASAAASSWRDSARLASTTESMSGESSSARPGAHGRRRRELEPARTGRAPRWCGSSRAGRGRPRTTGRSSGWQTRTGARVVGRRTPAGLTAAPTRLLTSVDLPAPVEPPTTISSGASMLRRRGSR